MLCKLFAEVFHYIVLIALAVVIVGSKQIFIYEIIFHPSFYSFTFFTFIKQNINNEIK